jgi:hypothetical protein
MSAKRRHASDTYTPEIAEAICERIANGETLRAIGRDPGMPDKRTVLRWREAHPDFAPRYARAVSQRAEHWAEEIIEISDDSSGDRLGLPDGSSSTDQEHIQRSRLRVDSRKWLLSKLLPKQYGDRVEINATVSRDPGELTDVELARLAADGLSALNPSKPPLIEHQPDPTHKLTHDNATAGSNGATRKTTGSR